MERSAIPGLFCVLFTVLCVVWGIQNANIVLFVDFKSSKPLTSCEARIGVVLIGA